MKHTTFYNRIERQEFTLSDTDVRDAVIASLKRSNLLRPLPSNAREQIEIEHVGESHNEFLKLTRKWIYDDEVVSGREEPS